MDPQNMDAKAVLEKIFIPILDFTSTREIDFKKLENAFKLIITSLDLTNNNHFKFFHSFIESLTILWQYKIKFHNICIGDNDINKQILLDWLRRFLEFNFSDTPYQGHIKSLFYTRIFAPLEINAGSRGLNEFDLGTRAVNQKELKAYLQARLSTIDQKRHKFTKPLDLLNDLLNLLISPLNCSIRGHKEKVKTIFMEIHNKFNLTNEDDRSLLVNLILAYFDCQLVTAQATGKYYLDSDEQLLFDTLLILIPGDYPKDKTKLQSKLTEISAIIKQNKDVNNAKVDGRGGRRYKRRGHWLTLVPQGLLKR